MVPQSSGMSAASGTTVDKTIKETSARDQAEFHKNLFLIPDGGFPEI